MPSVLGIEFIMIPTAAILIRDFDNLSVDVRSYREPLKRSIREVVSPSVGKNFDSEGRPSWDPLDEGTILDRSRKGESGPILQRSGALKRAAMQLNAWDISQDEAAFAKMPVRVEDYAYIQQFGGSGGKGSFIPARPFMLLQEEDVDDIVEVFLGWIDERLEARGFVS